MNHGPEMDALVAEKVMGRSTCVCTPDEFRDWAFGYAAASTDPLSTKNAAMPPRFGSDGNCNRCGHLYLASKHYSTSISAAWEVVEKMCALFPERPLRIGRRWGDSGMHDRWDTDLGNWWDADARDTSIRVRGDTAPHAICLAALKAVGAM